MWTLKKVNEFISDIKSDNVVLDGEAYDVARFLLEDDDDLYNYIKHEMLIPSPVEWLANKI